MPDDNDAPLIDVAGLRRDLYRLVVLLLADESVAEVDAFRDLADAHHEAEVNRLLIWVAIAVRRRTENMPTSRTAYKYHFKLGNKIVHTGITSDIDRREAEHQRASGWEKGHIFQVGNRTTRAAALEWENEQRKKGKPTGP